jgi:hypothetical protein
MQVLCEFINLFLLFTYTNTLTLTDLEVGSGLSDGDVVGRGRDVDEARVFPGRVLGRVIDVIAGNQKPER